MSEETNQNDLLVLISGDSGVGKSRSLKNIPKEDQPSWIYLNCENGKKLPFRHKFFEIQVQDPYEVYQAFEYAKVPENGIKGVIIDTLTFLMDMFESQYIVNSANSQKAWGDYAQFFVNLMVQHVGPLKMPVVILAHTSRELDEGTGIYNVTVPVKGSLAKKGIEARFSLVVSPKKVPVKELEKYGNKLLVITDEEKELGFKHVFQCRLTKASVGDRIRGPEDMFTKEQTYMDNDVWALIQHVRAYYAGED